MSLLLGLLLCLCCCSPASGAPHLDSLRVSIIITPIPRPQQPWCEAVVEVQGEPCFSYDCRSKEVRPVSVQGMKVVAPLREDLREILKDLTEKFKEKLLDSDPEDFQGSEPLSLQATLEIQEEASGRSPGSWHLVFSGHISLRLDLVTRAWTAAHPGDRWMLEKWEEDRDMDLFLRRTSRGAWNTWLQDVAAHLGTPGTTAPPNTPPGMPGTMSTLQEPWFIFGLTLACAILSGIIICFITWKRCNKERLIV